MRDEWLWRLKVGAGVGVWFWLVYGGADWLTGIRAGERPLPSPHIPLDMWVPFLPQAAWIYITITPLLLLPLFVLCERAAVASLAWTLATEIGLAGLVFAVYPVASLRMPGGELPAVMRFADQVNLTYNSLPSLHVALAVTCAATLIEPGRPVGNVLVMLWAAAISLSTLVTHQHFVLDVAAGLALAGFGIFVIRPRVQLLARAAAL